MKLMRMMIIIAALAILSLPINATAQHGDNQILMDRLVSELEITDEVLLRAKDVVMASDDETALTILKIAAERQRWAKTQEAELVQRFGPLRYSAALNATQKAREQARNAIAVVRRSDRHEGIVIRRLERTAELLERVRQIGEDHPDRGHLRDLYDSAVRSLERAREFYQQSQYRPALKLANQASSTATRILRVLGAGQPGMEKFERRQEAISQKILEAREQLRECEFANELLDNAEQAYQKALEFAEQGQTEIAHRQLQLSNEMILQAIRNCDGLENVDLAIERIKNGFEELWQKRDQFQGAQRDSFEAMLQQVKAQLELARNNADQQNYEAAKISIQAAHKALNQARRMAEMI